MNVNLDMTSNYMILPHLQGPKNKPNSNPIKPKTNPIQTQFKPKQTQFKPKQTQFKANFKLSFEPFLTFTFLCPGYSCCEEESRIYLEDRIIERIESQKEVYKRRI
ncbi:MAG: hypothetical protein FVQ84_16320 [Planctomycetes bacterium]|nr:hypothetical protein [Planctomycetota bacterium]